MKVSSGTVVISTWRLKIYTILNVNNIGKFLRKYEYYVRGVLVQNIQSAKILDCIMDDDSVPRTATNWPYLS